MQLCSLGLNEDTSLRPGGAWQLVPLIHTRHLVGQRLQCSRRHLANRVWELLLSPFADLSDTQ